ncbi:unnamed protein product [Didymodactylos carnosus]|uniref:5-formyltetrahydrofolate cyclo-ligase n=1 Tax=Didymodactylos carnosus TaxID=1234261 RepID=A0A813NGX9_9BILA|nr:unnamed protein product [Didymodactylos carnosus]CAF0742271.1 unnamed protein product [Didymodactylos carnosus]CAF3516663.1 unnamed protein product [Didymodactylos carnosus]CAF3519868.1 unnamed protein product [Didymodactylos carnosus]
MRVVVLPVCLLESYPHILLKYDFRLKQQSQTQIQQPTQQSTPSSPAQQQTVLPLSSSKDQYFLTPYCSPIGVEGSVKTVCNIIRRSAVLRKIFDVKDEEEENLENKIDFKGHCRFIAFGPETGKFLFHTSFLCSNSCFVIPDICICALLVNHISSLELNYINMPEPPLSRQQSKISYSRSVSSTSMLSSPLSATGDSPTPSLVQRDLVHLWISIRDIRHKLIHIDRVLKQPGILSKLIHVESWVSSYNEKDSSSPLQTPTTPKNGELNVPPSPLPSLITLTIRHDENIKQTSSPTTNPLAALTTAAQQSLPSLPTRLVKARARTLVWDIMEMKNEVLYPHPVHGRIPNFRNNPDCSANLAQLEEFQRSRVIQICPSLAQEHLRLFSLAEGKVLLTPSPSIDVALFYKLDPKFLNTHELSRAATKSGTAALGTVVNLSAVGNLHVDIVVVASVVVNPITGARLGKGKGYGDLEYAIMHQLGACDESTLVITTVHETQLLDDLPSSVMTDHDLPVNVIITPQRIIYTQNKFQRPCKINWNEIDNDTILNLPVLKEFKRLQQHQQIQQQMVLV